ncbi:MAG: TIGR03545 family protein [bacterium]
MIRWKACIPVVIIVTAAAIVYVFFIDTIVKKVIITAGQGIFNAKVEVRDVDVSLKNSSLKIQGLVIADEKEPFTNLLDIGSIIMDIRTLPVLEKKFIIDEVSVQKLTWGTKRTASGALPKTLKKEKKAKKESKDQESKPSAFKFPLDKLKGLGKKVDVKKLIDVDNLAAVKEAHDVQDQIKEKEQRWRQDVDTFKGYEAEVNAIGDELQQLKTITKISSLEDIQAAKDKIKKLKDARKRLEDMQKEIITAKDNLSKETQFLKNNINQLDALKNKDYKDIINSLGFGSLSLGNIGNALFGPLVMNKINAVISWTDNIRAMMPKTKTAKAQTLERKRLKGRDILFPKKKGLPGLLVNTVSFSAQAPEESEGPKLKLQGTIKNITSNPALLGKPITLASEGQFAGMKDSKLVINGSMDYTTDIPKETFTFDAEGLNLQGTMWSSGGEYMPAGIEKGAAYINAQLKRVEKTIDFSIKAQAQNIRFMPLEMKQTDQAKDIMNEIFSGIRTVDLAGSISGIPPVDLNVSLTSNLDDIVAQRLKEVFGREIEKQKALVRQELDNIVNAKKKELRGDLEGRKKEYQDKFLGSESMVQEKIDQAKGAVEKEEDQIKNYTKEKTKESTDNIQKDLKDQFKKLFK